MHQPFTSTSSSKKGKRKIALTSLTSTKKNDTTTIHGRKALVYQKEEAEGKIEKEVIESLSSDEDEISLSPTFTFKKAKHNKHQVDACDDVAASFATAKGGGKPINVDTSSDESSDDEDITYKSEDAATKHSLQDTTTAAIDDDKDADYEESDDDDDPDDDFDEMYVDESDESSDDSTSNDDEEEASMPTSFDEFCEFVTSGLPLNASYVHKLRRSSLSDAQKDQLATAFFFRIKDVIESNPDQFDKSSIGVYKEQIIRAKTGDGVDIILLHLLCPQMKNGHKLCYGNGKKKPPKTIMDQCPTVRLVNEVENHYNERFPNKNDLLIVDVRHTYSKDHPKCNKKEGAACTMIYDSLGMFFFIMGGEMKFLNIGGTSTGIKEHIADKLDQNYIKVVMASGHHVSLCSYLSERSFGTFENATTCITPFMRTLCKEMGIPDLFDALVKDTRFPMIIDLNQMESFKQKWLNGLSLKQRARYESRGVATSYKKAVVGTFIGQMHLGNGDICAFSEEANGLSCISIIRDYIQNNLEDITRLFEGAVTRKEQVTIRQAHRLMCIRGYEKGLGKWLKNATPEMLRERKKKRDKTMGATGLSEASKKAAKTLGATGLSEARKKRAKTLGATGLSEASKKAAKTLGATGLSEARKKTAKTKGATGLSEAGKKGKWKGMLQKALDGNKETCLVECSHPNAICSDMALASRNSKGGFRLRCTCYSNPHRNWKQVGRTLSRETIEDILEEIDSMNGNESVINVIIKYIS